MINIIKASFYITLQREQIKKLNKEKDTSIETTEKVFDFVIRAKSKFNHWGLQARKEILRWFGWNFELKDKKLHINQYKWFISIKKLSSNIKSEKSPLELIRNSNSKRLTNEEKRKIWVWYLERESNPHSRSRGILSPLCLPIPPSRQM